MTIREVVKFPNPILHQEAEPVDEVDDEIRTILDDLADTMYAIDGVGMAAPQINVGLRLAVLDTGDPVPGRAEGEPTLIKMVNPEIVHREGMIDWDEGCLSIPDFRQVMKRSKKVQVRYLDENGNEQTLESDGLLAIAIQQEIDHLNGVLIIDFASAVKQEIYLKKQKKAEEKNKK
jgi:peptide deformylase